MSDTVDLDKIEALARSAEQFRDTKVYLDPAVVLQWVAETRELREHFTGWCKEIAHYTTVCRERDALRAKLRVAVEALEKWDKMITAHFTDRDASSPSPMVLRQLQSELRTALDEIKKLSGERKK